MLDHSLPTVGMDDWHGQFWDVLDIRFDFLLGRLSLLDFWLGLRFYITILVLFSMKQTILLQGTTHINHPIRANRAEAGGMMHLPIAITRRWPVWTWEQNCLKTDGYAHKALQFYQYGIIQTILYYNMIRSKIHTPHCQDYQLLRSNQHKFEQNKETLDRMLSMKSLESNQKYEIKYRELKRTYNDLLGVSKELEREYGRIIEGMKVQHREEVETMKGVNQIQIAKLKQNIRDLQIRMNEKEERKLEQQNSLAMFRGSIRELQNEREELLIVIEDLKRQNYVLSIEKQKMLMENSYEMSSIKGILDKIDVLAKQLQLTKSALESERATSQLLRKELQQSNYRIDVKTQQNTNLLKEQQIKSRTITDMEKLININRSLAAETRKPYAGDLVNSPRKGRIVLEIHQMIENYKRNIKNY